MAAPSACTASTIGAIASTRSRVCTNVMPGDVRPSGMTHALPWMISATPARALGTNCFAYDSAASGLSPAPSSTGAR